MFIDKPIPKFFILLSLINLPFIVFIDGSSHIGSDFILSFFGSINAIFIPLLLFNSLSTAVKKDNNKDGVKRSKKIKNKEKSSDFEEKGNYENEENYNNFCSEEDRIIDEGSEQIQLKKQNDIKQIDYKQGNSVFIEKIKNLI